MRYSIVALMFLSLSACGEAPVGKSETIIPPTALELRRAERIKAMATNYNQGISFKDQYNAMDPRLKRSSIERGSRFDASDDYWGLPRTPGYEEVANNCAACHSLAIVMQQHVTPKRWDYLLKWMVEKQGMPPLEPKEHALIRTYLLKNFSSVQ